uniref:protein PXR1-like n=1 Tax=Osmia lignaria TaxID=473952 RepID=UPI001478A975|nr:protein PXR1-like [Osmia lignaria]
MKEKTEEIMKVVGVQDAIEEVKVAGLAEGGKEMNMVQIKLKSMEFKTDVMAKKKALRGRDERIQEDLAWKERRIQWKLRRISKEEREKGKNVWVDYGRIRIEGKWWRWGEEREILKDWGGTELYEKTEGDVSYGGREVRDEGEEREGQVGREEKNKSKKEVKEKEKKTEEKKRRGQGNGQKKRKERKKGKGRKDRERKGGVGNRILELCGD